MLRQHSVSCCFRWPRSGRKIGVLLVLLLVGCTAPPLASAQQGSDAASDAAPTVLDDLIDEALRRNLDLEQQSLQLRRSEVARTEARGGFLPQLDVQARYTRAAGGRTIDFPVGDLLNPVYQTLNDLAPGDPSFPTVENQEILFLREREQDTRLQLRQPLFAPNALYAYRAQTHEVEAEQAATTATRREIVRDVQVAYFRYRAAARRVEIIAAALRRVTENRRASERLVSADRATPDIGFRAEAEVLAVRQQLEEAEAGRRQARSALNLLLDRPLDSEIPASRVDSETLVDRRTTTVANAAALQAPEMRPALQTLQAAAQSDRPELRQLAARREAVADQRRLAQTRYLPTVSLAVESGIQGTGYGLDDDSRFTLASVVLQWNLFNGFQDRARVEDARLATRQIEVQREATRRQIDLQVQQALDDVRVAQRSLQTAEARLRAARSSFRLTERRYDVGRANLVTFTDAQSTFTEAELNLSITRFTLLTRLADLEYATGRPFAGP